MINTELNVTKVSDENEKFDLELRERIRDNFIFEIAEFLSKKEKIALREISKSFEKELFSNIQINLFLKKSSETEDFNNSNLDLKRILKFYQNMGKIKIESVKLNEKNLEILEEVMKQNQNSLKILQIMNIEYEQYEFLEKFYAIVSSLKNLTEISFGGIGNRDRLVLHLEKNNKELEFKKNIKTLKIDNLPLGQIQFLIGYFTEVSELTIENCSLDEDINVLIPKLICKKLTKLNLPLNGFNSNVALDSIRTIYHHQDNLEELSLKGMWFKSIQQLTPELKEMKNLSKLDFSASRYLFTEIGIDSTVIFKDLPQLRILDLSDSRVRSNNLETILKNFNEKVANSLVELNLLKNMIGHDCFDILIAHADKIHNLKVLNLGFNSQIGNKGFNQFVEKSDKFSFNSIDLRGCGILFKLAENSLVSLLTTKEHCLNKIELYYNTIKDSEYEALIKKICNVFKTKQINRNLNLKILFKFKINVELMKKFESELDFLYKKYNLVIR